MSGVPQIATENGDRLVDFELRRCPIAKRLMDRLNEFTWTLSWEIAWN